MSTGPVSSDDVSWDGLGGDLACEKQSAPRRKRSVGVALVGMWGSGVGIRCSGASAAFADQAALTAGRFGMGWRLPAHPLNRAQRRAGGICAASSRSPAAGPPSIRWRTRWTWAHRQSRPLHPGCPFPKTVDAGPCKYCKKAMQFLPPQGPIQRNSVDDALHKLRVFPIRKVLA